MAYCADFRRFTSNGIGYQRTQPFSQISQRFETGAGAILPTAISFGMLTNVDRDVLLASNRINIFLYSILRWSVAVYTMRRQSSRIPAFLQADAGPHLCCHQRSRSCYPDRQRRRPFQHVHLSPGLLSKAWMGNLEYFGFRPVYLKTKDRRLFLHYCHSKNEHFQHFR